MVLDYIRGDQEAAARTYAGSFVEYTPQNIDEFVSFEDRLTALEG